MNKKNLILMVISIFILSILLFSSTIIASPKIHVKDYIHGKFPVIFNIYLEPLGELDDYKKEFIDILETLSEEKQIFYAKEVYDNNFSLELLEMARNEDLIELDEIEEVYIEEQVSLNTGKWVYGEKTDPFTDRTVITFSLTNENLEDTRNPVYLILRYEKEKTHVEIDWNRDIYSFYRGAVDITSRFGDKKPTTKLSWELYSATKEILVESLFGVQPNIPYHITYLARNRTSFIKNLLQVDTFAVQLKLVNAKKITAIFDVSGLENAVLEFNDTLKWIE